MRNSYCRMIFRARPSNMWGASVLIGLLFMAGSASSRPQGDGDLLQLANDVQEGTDESYDAINISPALLSDGDGENDADGVSGTAVADDNDDDNGGNNDSGGDDDVDDILDDVDVAVGAGGRDDDGGGSSGEDRDGDGDGSDNGRRRSSRLCRQSRLNTFLCSYLPG